MLAVTILVAGCVLYVVYAIAMRNHTAMQTVAPSIRKSNRVWPWLAALAVGALALLIALWPREPDHGGHGSPTDALDGLWFAAVPGIVLLVGTAIGVWVVIISLVRRHK